MSKQIKIKRGLNIQLQGESEKTITDFSSITDFAIKPSDFNGFAPKLLVKEGDEVKIGSPVFFNKTDERIKITSPVSGTVKTIVRGEKRVIEEIQITASANQEAIDFGKANPNDLNKEQITEKILNSGVWAYIRQRPYNIIANPSDTPKAIFISGFDTAPLAPDYDFILHGKGDLFQTGIDAI